MIEMLIGKILSKDGSHLIINCNGVGYGVSVSAYTLSQTGKIGDDIQLFTFLKIGEHEMSLFGFQEKIEKDLFLQLSSVNGVGAKTAINILSTMQPKLLIEAISRGDSTMLTQAPGIGKKGAQKIILELKEKFNTFGSDIALPEVNNITPASSSSHSHAIKALIALGYRSNEAAIAVNKAVKTIGKDGTTQQIITEALKKR